MKRPSGFTLAELTLVMFLLAMIYALMLVVVIQVSNVSRRATLAASRQIELVKACEQLRWQLRCLYSQTDPQPDSSGNVTNTNTTNANPTQAQRADMIGQPGAPLLGQRAGDTRDTLLFITDFPKGRSGVSEVGYKLAEDKLAASDLLFRQFATRDVGGFHSLSDQTDGTWGVLLHEVRQFSIDYSKDGQVWQREWDETDCPNRIRVHLETQAGDVIDFQVAPGIGAGRW